MTTRPIIFLFGAVVLCGCSSTVDPKVEAAIQDRSFRHLNSVSLIQLLANPAKYHGKEVLVYGVVSVSFEVTGIFPSRDLAITASNGIWLDDGIDEKYYPKEEAHEGELEPAWYEGYVAGTFDATDGGHMGMWQGAIRKIWRFQVHPIKNPANEPLHGTPGKEPSSSAEREARRS